MSLYRTVYLAGPILGRTKAEANDWRHWAADRLDQQGVIGISPLRCEPITGERYGLGNAADPRFGTARAIAAKNRLDVRMCDMTLCFFPPDMPLSKGTLGELFWADAYEKPTILVSSDPEIIDHPVIQAAADWIVPTLDEAIDVIVGVLGGYAGGKNV